MSLSIIASSLAVALVLHAPAAASRVPRASPEGEVRAALAHYAKLVRKMDHAGIAAMFAPDGEIVNPGQDPIRGPAAIEAFLKQFSSYKVVSETLTAATTRVMGAQATQSGTYHQRVRAPDGKMLEVSGGFDAEWIRDAAGAWRIKRMSTTPSSARSTPAAKSGHERP